MSYQSIAVFIDAENFSHSLVDEAFNQISRLGAITKALAYGDFSNMALRNYRAVVQRHNIMTMQIFTRTNGKNSADIALALDAIELAATRRYDAFVIVSSDSDFNRLAQKLRDCGVGVIGVAKDANNAVAYDKLIVVNKNGEAFAPNAPRQAGLNLAANNVQIVQASQNLSPLPASNSSKNKRPKNRKKIVDLAQETGENLADESDNAQTQEANLANEPQEQADLTPENTILKQNLQSGTANEPMDITLAQDEPSASEIRAKKPKVSEKNDEILAQDEARQDKEQTPKKRAKKTAKKDETDKSAEPAKPKNARKSDETAKKSSKSQTKPDAKPADEVEPDQKEESKTAKKPAKKAASKSSGKPASKQMSAAKNDGLDEVREALRAFWSQNRQISTDGFIHCSLFGSAVREGTIKLDLKAFGFSRLGKLFDTFEAEGFLEQKLDGSAPKFKII